MLLPFCALIFGLALLVWSSDHFVDGASGAARYLHVPPLLIGMVVVGFGTSAPEMVISALASFQGNPGIAIGNAYGSNTANIGLILGLAALISPIFVRSEILRQELPILTATTCISIGMLLDGRISRFDAGALLFIFGLWMAWAVWEAMCNRDDSLSRVAPENLDDPSTPGISKFLLQLIYGLVLLVIASRTVVWGAVEIARSLGVSDMIIGLTIVALGTSLPELASAISATRKKEHDLALGNIIGSNLFNTLAVVGIAGAIQPFRVSAQLLPRDMSVMGGLTLSLFLLGYGFKQPGRISRLEGALLLTVYIAYMALLIIKR